MGALCISGAAAAQVAQPGQTGGSANAQGAEPLNPQSEVELQSGDPSVDNANSGEVVVTGSRLRRPNFDSPVPVIAIGGEEVFQQGQTSLGDTLNNLPQFRSTFAQQNPGAGIGITGLNLLDLRGLGTVRTLVLVNGRRHVAADILNNASSPDVNTISNDIVERIETVTSGSSAVYGSDAIAGVVNFILKRDYEGLQLRGQAAINEKGFGGNQFVSVLAGKNFSEGRGNVTLQGEYSRQERVYASDIPWFRRVNGFATVDTDSPGLVSASDGFPDAVFLRDIRSAATNRFGAAFVPQQASTARCGTGTLANDGPANTNGTPFSCNYFFTPEGRLVQQTGTRLGSGPIGTIVGGNGQTGREGTLLSILPFNERYNANLLARYQFDRALEVFVEAKYSRVNAIGNQLGPTFLNNTVTSLGNDARINPRLDNPFLNPADRATLAAEILRSGCGFTLGTAVTSATCQPGTAAVAAARAAAVANGSYRFLFGRTLIDLPDRDEFFRRNTYRVVGGLRGDFNTDWHYELTANYGRFEETADLRGFVNRQRFLLSLDAARNPATGQIQCRSQFDPTAAIGLASYVNSAATLASDVAACVPYNVFGGGDNRAAAAYFNQPIRNRSRLEQLDFLGFVSGDLSQLFELPGGPVSFSVGGEYRREKAFNNSDAAADTGISNAVFLGDVDAKPLKVAEAFGEIGIPLLRDIPFIESLSVNLAGRVSDYNTAAGTVYSYNINGEWSPVRDLRIRGGYARAVRAPNVSESSFPSVPNFANGFIDPCNANAIGNNPDRGTNCQNQLTAAQRANLPPAGYSLGIISGSNPNLQAEKSDSYTIGGVFTPRFLPGFALSVDYFDITVNDVIVTLSAQQIVNSCYDTPGGVNPLCNSFQRNLGAGAGSQGELPGQILANTLVAGPQNFARRVRRGIDTVLSYRTDITNDINFNTRINYVHTIASTNFEDPTRPNFANRILGEAGDPNNEFRWNVDVGVGPLTLGYIMRYIGPQIIPGPTVATTYENLNPLNGQAPLNLDVYDINTYPSVVYHNLRFDLRVTPEASRRSLNFTFGIDNVANKIPPLGTTATGGNTAIFDFRGRSFYAGIRANY